MAWRVARSLDKLLTQINQAAPGRNKASDGSIGDAAHQATSSDHNPQVVPNAGPTPVVTARDFTQDPAHGADMTKIAEALRLSRDKRIKYVIFNRRIFSGNPGPSPWVWRSYTGSSAHTEHMHVSVIADAALMDGEQPWKIGASDMTPEESAQLRRIYDLVATPVGAAYRDGAGNEVIGWQMIRDVAYAVVKGNPGTVLYQTLKIIADNSDPAELAQRLVEALPADFATQLLEEMGRRLQASE